MTRESSLVVKDNSLIEACFNLSLIEHRLMLLAIVEARELQKLDSNTPIEITALSYMKQYKVDKSESYKQLLDATKQLFSRQFSYLDRYNNTETEAISVSRWVNEITYVKENGMVVLYLNRNIIQMISRLEQQFTRYHLKQVSDFKSKYSIRIYELAAKWASNQKTEKYTIQALREKLGIKENEYKSVAYLKRDVIDKSIQEINKKSDLKIAYEQFKTGRTVSHIVFSVKQKVNQNSIKKEINLTEKQIEMFSDKLSNLDSFRNHFQARIGADLSEYRKQISIKLRDSFYIQEWMPFLKEVGFNA